VITEQVAAKATKVMQGVISTDGTAPDAVLMDGRDCAGKTGTSENYRDSWFCGFTPEYSVAIWLGNRQEKPTGMVTASSVFPLFMDQALADVAPKKFEEKEDPQFTPIDDDSLAISSTGYNAVDTANNAYSYDFTYSSKSSEYTRSTNDDESSESGVDEDGDGYDDQTGESIDDEDDSEEDSESEYEEESEEE
jgi:penicillin-binding protein 1A